MPIKDLEDKLKLLEKFDIDNKENLIENLYRLANHSFDNYSKKNKLDS